MQTTDKKSFRHARRARQRGFNFAEVLFAVMILGIGFIMIAGIFPVAISQTKTTGEEIVASTIARGGVHYFQQVGLTAQALPTTDLLVDPAFGTMPQWPNKYPNITHPTYSAAARTNVVIPPGQSIRMPGKMISFRDNRVVSARRDAIWRQVSGNLILPQDPRAAWIGMYRRGVTYSNTTAAAASPGATGVVVTPDVYAHVVVIGVQSRNRSNYDAKDLVRYNAAGVISDAPPATADAGIPGTLEPFGTYVKLTEREKNATTTDVADTITFCTAAGAQLSAAAATLGAYVDGAYIVIADDQMDDFAGATPAIYEGGQRNGRVYRLGNRRTDLGTAVWELAPGNDLSYLNPDGTVGNADDINENLPPRAVSGTPNVNAAGAPAYAFIVGRGRPDPTQVNSPREGLAQDTGVYVSLVPAN